MSSTQKYNLQLWVVIIGLSISGGTNSWTNSVSQTLIEVFPNIPVAIVRSAVTAGSLSSLVVGLLAGVLVGRKVSYRKAAIFGLTCQVIGGVVPAFYCTNFWVIWFCRFLTGFSSAANRLAQPLIARNVGSEKQAAWFGYANIITMLCTMVMQNIGASLGAIKWNYIYLVNVVMAIPLLLVVLKLEEPENVEKASSGQKMNFKIDRKIIPYLLLVMWGHLTLYPIFTSVSTVLVAKDLGGLEVASRISSFYTLGSICSGFVVAFLMKWTRRWTFTIGLLLASAGLGLVMVGPNLILIALGVFLAGASYGPLIFSVNAFSGDVAAPNVRTFSMIVVMAGASISGFASSFWTSFASNTFRGLFPFLASDVEVVSLVNIIVCLVIAVGTIFVNPVPAVRKDQ